jgi:hypothetical protein
MLYNLKIFKDFNKRFKWNKIPKYEKQPTPANTIKWKFKKSDLENLIMKYDVIHDGLRVICKKKLKRPRNFDDIGSYGAMCTGRNLAKNRKIA